MLGLGRMRLHLLPFLLMLAIQLPSLDSWETRIRHHRKYEERTEPREEYLRAEGRNFADNHVVRLASPPLFRSENNSVVVAHAGSTTSLPCQINKDTPHGVITWGSLEQVGRPYTLLTVGDSPYTDNMRFSIEKPIRHDQWNLLIKPVRLEDNGLYECQATTHPPQAIIVKLVVAEAFAEIIGTKEKVFKSESKLQLVCALRQATAKPDYIFWFHNSRMINYDTEQGISVVEDINGSTLTINSVSVSHSGNYSCQPSSMRPDSVLVTILAESKSANALQDKASSAAATPPFLLLRPLLLVLILPLVAWRGS